MPHPSRCPNPDCTAHWQPAPGWSRPYGAYESRAHGRVLRFRCRYCRTTCSTQTESMHFAAKHHLPLRAISSCLLEGASQREIARRFRVSPMTIHFAVIRLGRQAIAAQSILLSHITPRRRLVFDGLRSYITSQDYPCDLTTLVDAEGETILSVTHGVFRRGGRMTRAQRRRVTAKQARWKIPKGTMRRAISMVWSELWHYLDHPLDHPAVIDTDRHLGYLRTAQRSTVYRYLRRTNLAEHHRTDSRAPRTMANPLFPVNYIDRLIRHRLREHTRETIAFGRHSSMQMYRMWVFAWDLNTRRLWRVKRPRQGLHAQQGTIDQAGMRAVRRINRSFYQRRVDPRNGTLPDSLREAWEAQMVSPPLRWKSGQKGTTVRVPQYVHRDIARAATRFCIRATTR